MSSQPLGCLVTFPSSRGLLLDGILYHRPGHQTIILHVHGSLGNFYQNQFVRVMAQKYADAGMSFLSFNLANHDGVAEGYKKGDEFLYVGGSVADFGECVSDIQGAIDFARDLAPRIILQGHSLGCDRVLHFLVSTSAEYDFVLLAPCDSYELQRRWIAPETVEEQISRLKADAGTTAEALDWLPAREYGISQGDGWVYPIPVTRKALLSIMEGPVFKLIRIEHPARFWIKQNAFIYIGGFDALQTAASDKVFDYFEKRTKHVTRSFVREGDHMLRGCEDVVAEGIVDWINVLSRSGE